MPITIVPKPKRKPPVPKKKNKDKKVPIIKPDPNQKKIYVGGKKKPTKTELESEFLNKKGGGYMKKNMMGGGMVGGQKKLDVNKDGMITGADFEMMGANRKKNGGKISYKMAGGQVVDSSYE